MALKRPGDYRRAEVTVGGRKVKLDAPDFLCSTLRAGVQPLQKGRPVDKKDDVGGLEMAMNVALGVLIGFVVAGTSVSGGQIGYLWSFEELAAKADTIAIAEHIETVDVRRGVVPPDRKSALPFVEMESVFEVMAFLKPEPSPDAHAGTKLRLRHYRVDMEEFHRREGPLKSLLNAGSSLDFGKEKETYLLFLKRVEGTLCEPLSGHTFPTASVRLVRTLTR